MPQENLTPRNAPDRPPIAFEVPAHLADKEVFTTGEAAKIMKVSQQTVIRVFDSGELKGWRIPGSRFRRIPRAVLDAYIQSALGGRMTDAPVADEVHLTTTPNGEALACNNTFELGTLVQRYNGQVRRIIVQDTLLTTLELESLREQIARQCERLGTSAPQIILRTDSAPTDA